MKIETNIITAKEGKIFKRKSDGHLFQSPLYLGYTYYLNDKRLEKPILEKPEDYEEIDIPEEFKKVM